MEGKNGKIINYNNNLIETKQSMSRKKISFENYLKTASSIVKNRASNSLKRAIQESKNIQ